MNVAVLAGGVSTERDVSLISGKMIYEACKKNGHRTILLDVYLGYAGEEKDVFSDASVQRDWALEIAAIGEKNPDIRQIKALRPDGDRHFFGPRVLEICQAADMVFLALHGENGENGKVQACFDLLGIRYTGTDYLSSAIAMHKHLTKDLFRQHGIPTPEGFVIFRREGREETYRLPESFPCIVKANAGGSSIGVSIARSKEEYGAACREAFRYDDTAIVERYIEGREFSVSVVGGKALPIIEIAPKEGFYDYKNKYQAGSTVETCPAKLSEALTKSIQECAVRAFSALNLRNYARFDLMLDKEGSFYFLEANTLPGMTPTSLLPQEAAAAGMDFPALCEKLLRLSADTLRDDRE